jgi:hypothetical protein
MRLRWLNSLAVMVGLLLLASVSFAQTANTPREQEDQGEAFRDTMVRMQIKREEDEHKKRLAKASKIRDLASDLLKDSEKGRLSGSADRKLRDIEKAARQIRSELGGSNDDTPLESPPETLNKAVHQMDSLSEQFNSSLEKTSRQVVSATVLAEASEIIQLVKLIRSFLN